MINVNSPKYDSTDFTDVPYLDAAATLADNGDISIFAINRSMEEVLPLETELRGFENYIVKEHIVLKSEGAKDTNTEECPNNVVPQNNGNAQIDGNKLVAALPKLSWNVIHLEKMK